MTPADLTGGMGAAWRYDPAGMPRGGAAVVSWLIRAPWAFPYWEWFSLDVVTLADVPGFPPARLQFEGATHELVVQTIDPERFPDVTPEEVGARLRAGLGVPFLTPVNVAWQFTGTDEEARELARYAVLGVVNRAQLNPETDAGGAVPVVSDRDDWAAALGQTLAHLRGEHEPK